MWENLLAVVMFALVTSFTPGPNNTLALANGANFGLRGTVPHILGTMAGFSVMLVAVGFGLGNIFVALPVLEDGLRLAATGAVLYLGYRVATASLAADVDADAKANAKPITFRQAAMFQVVNPKGWAICFGIVGAYSNFGSTTANVTIFLAVFLLTTPAAIGSWASFGTIVARALDTPHKRLAFNLAMAALLVASVMLSIW